MAEKTFSVRELASALGIGRNSAYEAVKRGEIPHVIIGKRILIPKVALEKLLAEASSTGKQG